MTFTIPKEIYNSPALNISKQQYHINEQVISCFLSQLYSINEVSKQFEKSLKTTTTYDFVIITRLDILLKKLPNLKNLNINNFYLMDSHKGCYCCCCCCFSFCCSCCNYHRCCVFHFVSIVFF